MRERLKKFLREQPFQAAAILMYEQGRPFDPAETRRLAKLAGISKEDTEEMISNEELNYDMAELLTEEFGHGWWSRGGE